ncbi:MAG: flagellar assembly protein FliW [bacterium]
MRIETLQFGTMEIEAQELIEFPRGLLGFESYRRFVLIEKEDCQPFQWLQSVEAADLALVVVNPKAFFPDYRVKLHAREVADISATDPEQVEILCIVTIPAEIEKMSVNLQGPLLVNRLNNTAKQIVLTDSEYTVQHFVVPTLARRGGEQKPKAPAVVP